MLGIQGQKDEVEKLMAGLEGVIADLEGANVVMGKVVEDDWMGREIREMEEEVRAAGRDAKL